MLNLPESTDWLSPAEQQAWFNQFKCPGSDGLKFQQFREFLKTAIYAYFSRLAQKKNPQHVEELRFTYQQEMLLFRVFDSKNDHMIDLEEFSNLCQNWLVKTYRRTSALVIVDVQNDFIDGSLALINGPAGEDGAEVVPVINKLLDKCHFDAVVYTQDWHPPDHIGFHVNLHLRKYTLKEDAIQNLENVPDSTQLKDNSPAKQTNDNITKPNPVDGNRSKFKLKRLMTNANVFDTVLFDDGKMEQKLWPAHCIQDSWGAELHPKLKVLPDAIKIHKGTLSHVDAYSAFWDNMKINETGLRQELTSRKIDDVFFCGLALDYCVAASALDSINAGFTTFVIEDACRGIDKREMEVRKKHMIEKGVMMVNSDVVETHLLSSQGSEEGLKFAMTQNGREVVSYKISTYEDSINSKKNLSVVSGQDGENNRLLLDICFKRAIALNTG